MNQARLTQSYLILGTKDQRRKKTKEICEKLSVKLDKSILDLEIISPTKIHVTIDQIRHLKRTIFHKPIKSSRKVVIIEDAHKLTTEAQNALLKILEEPPLSTLIFLEADTNHNLLSTILSRTAQVRAQESKISANKSIFENNLGNSLELISKIDNYEEFLKREMETVFFQLRESINKKRADRVTILSQILTDLAEAKTMADANVNPKHGLLSLLIKYTNDGQNSLV